MSIQRVRRRLSVSGLLALALTANVASGQVMLSPTAVVGTDLGTFDPIAPVVNMINQSGLDTPFVSGSTDFVTYFSTPNKAFAQNGGTNNWQSDFSFNLPLTGFVDFDLGASYRIDKMAIWNISVSGVTVKLYEDLNGPEQVAGNFTLTNHVNFPFSYPADVIRFGTPQQGRYVRLAITSAYKFDLTDTFAYAIIGEVVVSAQLSAQPTLSIILNPNGDVTVTFTGTLQTATTVDGEFVDVTGNPQGTYMLPRGSLAAQQFFRAKDD